MNLTAIADVVNELYAFLIVLGAIIMLLCFRSGIMRFMWSSQMGGMNSMGTRNFTAEGGSYIFAGLVAGFFTWLVTATTGDLFGTQPYAWKPLQQTDDSMRFVGDFITRVFTLLGFVLAYKSAGTAKKIGTGEATFALFITQISIAILLTQVEWASNQISTFTPFNPLGIFFGQSLFTPP